MHKKEEKIRGRDPIKRYKETQNRSPGQQLNNRSRSTSSTISESDDEINSHSEYEYYEYSEESEGDGDTDNSPTRRRSYQEKRSTKIVKESYEPSQMTQHREHDTSTNRCSQSLNRGFSFQFVICVLLAIIVVVAAVVSGYLRNETSTGRNYINCTFDELAKMYPSQKNDTWMNLRIIIEGVLNEGKPKPANYLFLYDDKKSIDLVQKIARRASQCFDPHSEPIEITLKEFSSDEAKEEYGTIIKLYKERMKDGGVAIIANLNEIPPKVARALHSICDMYDPIVDKAVNFLTLKPTIKKGKLIEIAEKSLSNLWSSLTDYELDPLITRVTDQIIKIDPF